MRSALQVKYDALLRENTQQRKQLAELTVQIAGLAKGVATANDRIAELLAAVQRKRRKPAKPPPPPPAPSSLDDAARDAYENRPKASPLPDKEKPPKTRHTPTGRKPLPEHLPADEHVLQPEACKCCASSDFEWVDEVVEIKLHVVEEHQRRRVVRRKTGNCKSCGTRTTARSLPAPFKRSKATCEWLAWMIHQKFVMLAPLDRLRRDLVAKGLPLSMSYLVSQVARVAELLDAIDGVHWKQLLASDWMATDATGLKVLVPKLGCHNGYLEVYRRDDVVVFQYEPHKGGDVLASKLQTFEGILVADAEHRHNQVFADGTVKEAGCNAHGRRKFRDAEAEQPVLAVEGGTFIANIYVAEAKARTLGLIGDALCTWRQTKMRPIRDAFGAWMDAVWPALLPGDAVKKVINYYRNHWDAMFLFIDHPEVPIDNSASEREFQNVAKLRLNVLFAGSTEGAHRTATLLGLAATCKALKIDTQAYLAWALTRRGTHRDLYGLSAAELTPAAYSRSLADSGG